MSDYIFEIQCRESGEIFGEAKTLSHAKLMLSCFEIGDNEEGIYTPNYYAIINIETGEIEE